MRLTSLFGLAIIVMGVGVLSAQDDLSQLVGEGASAVTLEFQSINVVDALEAVATIGGFQLQLSPGVSDASPVTGRLEDANLANVLRFVLAAAAVNYRVVKHTLIVGPPANTALKNPGPWCSRQTFVVWY
jgi:type II secretory pathway component HofQ